MASASSASEYPPLPKPGCGRAPRVRSGGTGIPPEFLFPTESSIDKHTNYTAWFDEWYGGLDGDESVEAKFEKYYEYLFRQLHTPLNGTQLDALFGTKWKGFNGALVFGACEQLSAELQSAAEVDKLTKADSVYFWFDKEINKTRMSVSGGPWRQPIAGGTLTEEMIDNSPEEAWRTIDGSDAIGGFVGWVNVKKDIIANQAPAVIAVRAYLGPVGGLDRPSKPGEGEMYLDIFERTYSSTSQARWVPTDEVTKTTIRARHITDW